jgi:hypothetical protein
MSVEFVSMPGLLPAFGLGVIPQFNSLLRDQVARAFPELRSTLCGDALMSSGSGG